MAVRGGLGRLAGVLSQMLVLMLVAGCAAPTMVDGMRDPTLRPTLDHVAVDFRPLPGWIADDHSLAIPAMQRTCSWVVSAPPDKPMGADPLAGSAGDWRAACAALGAVPPGDPEAARVYFETQFTPILLGGREEGLFTGYYEPVLRGSWVRTAQFTVPIYRVPPRSKNGLPSRARINNGALAGRGLELMWVDDPIEAFFTEIQGSGRVVMADGSTVGIGYAGQNGHSYFPIGRHLIDEGIATREEMSLQYLRRWMHQNPDKARALQNLNPSYVFFKLRGDGGARGARNMELTPGRSLAVDPDHVPLGPPLWVELRDAPVPGGVIRRLVLAQDTGGAIKGAVRGDLYWGHGPEAEEGAGLMKARGRYSMLVPRHLRPVATAQRRLLE